MKRSNIIRSDNFSVIIDLSTGQNILLFSFDTLVLTHHIYYVNSNGRMAGCCEKQIPGLE